MLEKETFKHAKLWDHTPGTGVSAPNCRGNLWWLAHSKQSDIKVCPNERSPHLQPILLFLGQPQATLGYSSVLSLYKSIRAFRACVKCCNLLYLKEH